MATQVSEIVVAAPEPRQSPEKLTRAPEKSASTRLVSLDAYRGFIMLLLASSGFGLAVLQNYPKWSWLANQVDHAPGEGCTVWDLIQPAFKFMVGVPMPFPFGPRVSQVATTGNLVRDAACRGPLLN